MDNAALDRLSARRARCVVPDNSTISSFIKSNATGTDTRLVYVLSEFTWRSFFIRITLLSTLIGVTVFALMFYPRMPDYNVCNREFDWESILHSMMSLHPKIEYQVLISAINENRFGFQLEEGYADIYHNGTRVGYWKLEAPIEAKAGSITDVIAPIKIEPGYSEAYSLWTAFSNNELVFRINATVSGSITYGTHKVRTRPAVRVEALEPHCCVLRAGRSTPSRRQWTTLSSSSAPSTTVDYASAPST